VACATILDLGTEEQKREHIPPAIRGERIWVQLLSEPSGGSDLAGALMRAVPDGDGFRLSGSKIWSSAAYICDWGLCLARTNWDVPKHQGLTMFLVDMREPGITIQRIRQVNGNNEFCQEFFDNVWVPRENVLGAVNDGWAVASRQLFHERTAVGGGSPFLSGSGPGRGLSTATTPQLVGLLRRSGQQNDVRAREVVAESHALTTVQTQLINRIAAGIDSKVLEPPNSSIIRLFKGEAGVKRAELALEIAGPAAVAGAAADEADEQFGVSFLFRQASSLGGGSSEMSRNVISERVLGMPREYAADRGVPFKDVRHGN
jgi:alkylation response protein AidB-like acyl-CoA dehydrogenase